MSSPQPKKYIQNIVIFFVVGEELFSKPFDFALVERRQHIDINLYIISVQYIKYLLCVKDLP